MMILRRWISFKVASKVDNLVLTSSAGLGITIFLLPIALKIRNNEEKKSRTKPYHKSAPKEKLDNIEDKSETIFWSCKYIITKTSWNQGREQFYEGIFVVYFEFDMPIWRKRVKIAHCYKRWLDAFRFSSGSAWQIFIIFGSRADLSESAKVPPDQLLSCG